MSDATFTAYDGEEIPVDLDGQPYRETEHLGAWKMTRCCGAAMTGTEDGIACKHCWQLVTDDDGPAHLPRCEECGEPLGDEATVDHETGTYHLRCAEDEDLNVREQAIRDGVADHQPDCRFATGEGTTCTC